MTTGFADITPNKLARGRDIAPIQRALATITGAGGIAVDFDGAVPRIRQESVYGAEACGPFTPTVKRADLRADEQIWIGNGVSGIGKRKPETPGIIMYAGKKVVLAEPESVALWDKGAEGATAEGAGLLTLQIDSTSTDMAMGGFYQYVWLTLDELNALVDWNDTDGKYHYPLAWVSVANVDLPEIASVTEGQPATPAVTVRRVASMRWVTTEWFVSVPGGGGGGGDGGPTTVRVSGAPVNGRYPVQVFGNGPHVAHTGTAFVEILNLSISEILPTNTWLNAFWTKVGAIEGP